MSISRKYKSEEKFLIKFYGDIIKRLSVEGDPILKMDPNLLKDHCELCNGKKGSISLFGRFKGDLGYVKFIRLKVNLILHILGHGNSITVCDKCHFYYHCFQFLSDTALEEWMSSRVDYLKP